jgi:hypothetical protein
MCLHVPSRPTTLHRSVIDVVENIFIKVLQRNGVYIVYSVLVSLRNEPFFRNLSSLDLSLVCGIKCH